MTEPKRLHQYGVMPAGRYLKTRFNFEFTQDPREEVVTAQDALFCDAREVERRRRAFPRTTAGLAEDYEELARAMRSDGPVQAPLYPYKRVDPLEIAKWVEEAEYSLGRWVEVVQKLQQTS